MQLNMLISCVAFVGFMTGSWQPGMEVLYISAIGR
jgi:hypothetical protein